jgi:small subunit ribosomal protein S20
MLSYAKFKGPHMPILHASYKDIKVTKKRALRNQSIKSQLKTETKKFLDLLASKKNEEVKKQLTDLISQFDKAASKGIIHKKTASRKKSRLMKKLGTLKSTS